MNTPADLDRFPENTVVVSGEALLKRRHMPTPPHLETAIRGPRDPRHLYELLREEYPANHPLYLIRKGEAQELELSGLDSEEDLLDNADYLLIPPLPEQFAFETFQDTVAILRGPHGCPWDKKQTHQSLRDDLLQEVYELLDGLDRADLETVTEELGDVLLHILLQAQIGVDNREFTMGDVISRINDKIIFRHEHVFGNPEDIDPEQVMQRWEQLKQKERSKKHKKGGLLDGISRAMPALSLACSYQKRASKAGFDWEEEAGVWDKLAEELEEFKKAETPGEKEEELGDILFCIVNLARWVGVDPETALRMASLKFYDRFRYVEKHAEELQRDLFEMPPAEKEQYWNDYKATKRAEKNE